MRGLRRRGTLLAGLAAGLLAAARRGRAAPGRTLHELALPARTPMAQVQPGGPTGLLGLARDGGLWALSLAGTAPRPLARGLDPATPVASGHGRVAARTREGALWVREGTQGPGSLAPRPGLAPHAGLLVLRLAVLGVGAGEDGHRLLRFERTATGAWQVVARSAEPVLPDARPLQADLDGRGDGGHVVVLAGPDAQRYRHGVLGDATEATRLLWLERHDLQVMRALALPPPHVFEDIAPRPVARPGAAGVALLTVRSGPEGGQLALVSADPNSGAALRLEALGEPVGGFHRWLAPTTDGHHWAAVHTPHIGGVLHTYHLQGAALQRRRLTADVSTHAIGSRETDLAVWRAGRLLLPSQDGRRLRVLDLARDGAEDAGLALPARLVQATAVAEASAWVGLLADGRVVWMTLDAAPGAARR